MSLKALNFGCQIWQAEINIEINSVRNVGIFVGQNNIGKILMICRHCLIEGIEPTIDFDFLQSAHIVLFGKELALDK